jgi:hypothetical protein
VAAVIAWLNREDDSEVPASDWWAGLPGTDWRYPEGGDMREVADRMIASQAVIVFYQPDLSNVDYWGGWGKQPEKAFKDFMQWLTPITTERQDPIDGYLRRRCLINALNARTPGTDPLTIVKIARSLYERAWNPEATPDTDRRPLLGRKRLRGVGVS